MSGTPVDDQEHGMSRLPMDRALRDGYEVHRAALAHGLNVTLLPRQVLEVRTPDGAAQSTFVHGVPQGTKLSSATYAQDQRMRRALLSRAGFKVPFGATFSVGRSAGSARRYAKRIGYPVVVKPAVGDNTVEVIRDIRDGEGLQEAIEYLHTPPSDRPLNTRASYALTELREPGMKNGKVIVPPGYRFLVEKQVSGQYLRLLVLQGQVISALHCPDGPWGDEPPVDILNSIYPGIKQTAIGATRAIQGLALAAVDVVVPDYSRYVTPEKTVIVEYSERPWLQVQWRTRPELSRELGEKILGAGFSNGQLAPRRDSVEVNFRIDGSVNPTALLPVLNQEWERLGLKGAAEVTDAAIGYVEGTMDGPPDDIAWLFENVLDVSGLQGERAMLVECATERSSK